MNRTIGLFRKFQQVVHSPSLITICKAFIRLRLDYVNVIFNQAFNNSFHQRLESIQYKSDLAITAAIRGTSKEKFRVPVAQKMVSKITSLLQNNKKQVTIISLSSNSKDTNFIFYSCNSENLPPIKANHNFFKNNFFPSTNIE